MRYDGSDLRAKGLGLILAMLVLASILSVRSEKMWPHDRFQIDAQSRDKDS